MHGTCFSGMRICISERDWGFWSWELERASFKGPVLHKPAESQKWLIHVRIQKKKNNNKFPKKWCQKTKTMLTIAGVRLSLAFGCELFCLLVKPNLIWSKDYLKVPFNISDKTNNKLWRTKYFSFSTSSNLKYQEGNSWQFMEQMWKWRER